MRKSIDSEVLAALVNNVCSSVDSFSAYDITSMVRKQLPNHEVSHDEVKTIVLNYALSNQLSVIDNGSYRIFTKQFKDVKPATGNSIKVIFDGREPDVTTAPASAGKATNNIDTAKRMMDNFGPKNSVQALRAKVRDKHLIKSTGPKITRRYNLQSEGRLVLPADLVGGNTARVNVNGRTVFVSSGQRFRTGLSARMVDVLVYNDHIDIVPV